MDARAYICSDPQEDRTSTEISQVQARLAQMGDAGIVPKERDHW
jgi:hypothetical protein